MIIAIDTREQTPLRFGPDIKTKTVTLPAGDYSIIGLETQIAIERKSLMDLIGTIGAGRDRFERELLLLRGYRFACIFVEALPADVEAETWRRRNPRSQITANHVWGACVAFMMKYGVATVWCGDHATCGRLVERQLTYCAKIVERELRAV